MKTVFRLLPVAFLIMAGVVYAYTPAETNDVVRGMLFHVVRLGSHDNFPDNGGIVVRGPIPDTWEGFLGGGREGPWTTVERKAAFDWYLSTLGTTDFTSVRSMDKKLVLAALTRCELFSYTNSAPSLRALALNPKGVYREDAIQLYLKFAPVGDAATSFIETVMTNDVCFSSVERGISCGVYSDKVRLFNPTNAVEVAAKERAVQMFYRNRNFAFEAAYLIDALFVSCIEGYAMSSNRLETALSMLSKMEPDDFDRKDIVAVTNQLLSSGRPLVQLTIGEGGGE